MVPSFRLEMGKRIEKKNEKYGTRLGFIYQETQFGYSSIKMAKISWMDERKKKKKKK